MCAEIAIDVQRELNTCRDSYLCAEIAVFVLNLSDIIFLRTVPHIPAGNKPSHVHITFV